MNEWYCEWVRLDVNGRGEMEWVSWSSGLELTIERWYWTWRLDTPLNLLLLVDLLNQNEMSFYFPFE